ncbi:MAG: carbohydrate porin [Planctomycetota bacterium]
MLHTTPQAALAATAIAIAPIALAQPAEPPQDPPREWFGVPNAVPYPEWGQATGDWAGLRIDLESVGLTVEIANLLEFSQVLSGGVEQNESFRNLFTAGVALDTDTALDLPGGTAFIQYLSVSPESGGSTDAGDLQVFSNLENDRSVDAIYELWYEQRLLDDRLRFKVGKLDANSEFAAVGPPASFTRGSANDFAAAGEPLNSSAGFSPTVVGFPSYPDSAMGFNVFVTPLRTDTLSLTLGYGLYDGAAAIDGIRTGTRGPSTFFSADLSNDYFHVAEAQLGWARLAALSGGSLSLGGWHHTGTFDTFDGNQDDGTSGLYATVQQRLTAPRGDTSDQGLYAIAQLGFADGDVAEVERHYALGLVQAGLGSFRPDDATGFYASYAELSDEPAAGFDSDEITLEAFYRAQLTAAAFLQPDLQWVLNPSGDSDTDDAVVLSIRFGVNF